MEFLQSFFSIIGDLTWGWSLVPILVVTGLFFTLSSRFVQLQFFGRMFRVLWAKNQTDDPNAISGREALLVSVGGRVGGGNIAGVAAAITLGGPGAVFWMWMIALAGMATSLIECTLAQVYKTNEGDGTFRGGPAQAIMRGLGSDYRWLAAIYSVSLIAVFAFGFNAYQGNTVAGAALNSMGIDRIWTAILLAGIAGFIVYGGIQRIAKTADVVVPIMAIGYIGMAVIVILMNISEIPRIFNIIVQNAFGFQEAVSGGMGIAISQGLRRGLFSNEAGLGSAPNVAATAQVKHPVNQGITQSLSVFIDTILICSCTAFVVLLSDAYVPGVANVDGIVLTQQALASHLGSWTQYFVTIALLLFAFSSVIYNYYLGENALAFLTKSPIAIQILRLSVIGVLFLGAVAPGATSIFFFSDPMMGILALVNLGALMMMFPTVLRVLSDFRQQLKDGIEEPVFDPAKFSDLNIDPTAWEPNALAQGQQANQKAEKYKAAA